MERSFRCASDFELEFLSPIAAPTDTMWQCVSKIFPEIYIYSWYLLMTAVVPVSMPKYLLDGDDRAMSPLWSRSLLQLSACYGALEMLS
jgi:hypothetical protein